VKGTLICSFPKIGKIPHDILQVGITVGNKLLNDILKYCFSA